MFIKKRSELSGLSLISALTLTLLAAPSPAASYTPTCTLLDARSAEVSGDIFLGGDFIELGLSESGSFGTVSNAPSGFRTSLGSNQIGMTADLDGFCATPGDNVDRPIDFFMPGTEEERWTVGFELAGVQKRASFSKLTSDSLSTGLSATHETQNLSTGDLLRAQVTSTISDSSGDLLNVYAIHSFEKSDAYYSTTVYFQNLSGQTLTNVRYMRSFDPDNLQFDGGGYDTTNTVLSQRGNVDLSSDVTVDASIVQAKALSSDVASSTLVSQLSSTSGISTDVPVVFFSAEEESVAYEGGFANTNPFDPTGVGDFFSSDVRQAPGSTVDDDAAIGIIVRQTSVAAGAISDPLVYVTSLDSRDFSVLASELQALSLQEPPQIEAPVSNNQTPEPYSGPVMRGVTSASGVSSYAVGETVKIGGDQLSGVSNATIGDVEAKIISSSPKEFSVEIPEGLSPGTYDLQVMTSSGLITLLDALTITGPSPSSPADDVETMSVWTKRISDTQAKVYIKWPTLGSKIRVLHQVGGSGSYEVLFVKTLTSYTDDALVVSEFGTYIVRSIDLEAINRIRISVDNEEIWKVRYNQ